MDKSEQELFESEAVAGFDKEYTPLVSIAISLKRIADALNTCNEYGEVGSEALANSIMRGLRGVG